MMTIAHKPAPSRIALCLLACAAVLLGCAPSAPDSTRPAAQTTQSASPRRLVAAIHGNLTQLSRGIDAAGSGNTDGLPEVESLVNVGLARFDRDGNLRGALSDAVPSTDNGQWRVEPDGRMEITWQVRPDARWHDGTPVTAQDLAFTAQVVQDARVVIGRGTMWAAVEGAAALDERTLVVRWARPFIAADQLFTTGVRPMPKHILEPIYQENPASVTAVSYWSTEFVGTGPFRVRSWPPGGSLVLQANDAYFFGRPRLDEVEVRVILDGTTMVANLLAGAVDVSMGRGLSLEQALDAQAQSGGPVRAETALQSWTALFPQFLNPTPQVLLEANFRAALLHALDRQELSNQLQRGLSPPADTFVIPGDPEYSAIRSSIVVHEYDPRRAMQLLDQVGLARGPDGTYRDVAGQPLTVQARTTEDDLRQRLLLSLGQYWQAVGVTLDPVVIPGQRTSDREYRASRPGFELTRTPSTPDAYRSSEIPLAENRFVGNNRLRYSSPALDSLIDRYYTTIPKSEQLATLGQIVRHISGELVTLGVFYTVVPQLMASRTANVAFPPSSLAQTTWNAEQWDVKS